MEAPSTRNLPVFRRTTRPPLFFLCGFGKSGTNRVGHLHPTFRCDGEFHSQHFLSALGCGWQPRPAPTATPAE